MSRCWGVRLRDTSGNAISRSLLIQRRWMLGAAVGCSATRAKFVCSPAAGDSVVLHWVNEELLQPHLSLFLQFLRAEAGDASWEEAL